MASLFSLCFDVLFVVVLCKLLHFHCANFKRKSEQGNEALCIMVIILVTGREACQCLAVQRVWRSCTGFDDVTFVKLEFDFAGNIFLS